MAYFHAMRPIAKFAIFLALAGVLAFLFAFVPGNGAKKLPFEKADLTPETSEAPARIPMKAFRGKASLGDACPVAAGIEKIISPQVKVPAIRGENNYGWVLLPRGTKVGLVRASADTLWVRWDGTTVKVPQVAAATGAIIVR